MSEITREDETPVKPIHYFSECFCVKIEIFFSHAVVVSSGDIFYCAQRRDAGEDLCVRARM